MAGMEDTNATRFCFSFWDIGNQNWPSLIPKEWLLYSKWTKLHMCRNDILQCCSSSVQWWPGIKTALYTPDIPTAFWTWHNFILLEKHIWPCSPEYGPLTSAHAGCTFMRIWYECMACMPNLTKCVSICLTRPLVLVPGIWSVNTMVALLDSAWENKLFWLPLQSGRDVVWKLVLSCFQIMSLGSTWPQRAKQENNPLHHNDPSKEKHWGLFTATLISEVESSGLFLKAVYHRDRISHTIGLL